ncbi:YkgJ family cysteine cluster protein [bacterium]|nr:YkgJ family cysteine cluster protein [bacterium]
MNEVFDSYCQFIRVITQRINTHFEEQSEYIHCKEGCSLCCRNGEYPCTDLESQFLKFGMNLLPMQLKVVIEDNIHNIKNEKAKFKGNTFEYVCPFLINDRCSVYNFRPLICRTFGLTYYEHSNGKNFLKIPFCVKEGLNYHEVYDEAEACLSSELFKQKGFNVEPQAYNLSPDFLISKVGKEMLGLDFGELKTIIDWF